MRLVVARCQVDYAGRLTAHLPMATRVLMLKSDGSVLVALDISASMRPWFDDGSTAAATDIVVGVVAAAAREPPLKRRF